MSCVYSGLDNQCSLYKVDDRMSGEGPVGKITMPRKTVAQHSKFITNCLFFGSDQQLLTASADTRCALWDVEQKGPVQEFRNHKSEVLG